MPASSRAEVVFFGHQFQPGEKLDVVKAVGAKGSLLLTSACLAEDRGSATIFMHTPQGLKFAAAKVSTTKPFTRLDVKLDMSVSPWSIEVSGAKLDVVGFIETDARDRGTADSKIDNKMHDKADGIAASKANVKVNGMADTKAKSKAEGNADEPIESKQAEAELAKKPDTNGSASAGSSGANAQPAQKRKAEGPPVAGSPAKKVTTLAGGLKFEVIKASGNPQKAIRGHSVQVRYEGRLESSGKRFDKGTLRFKLGAGEVIKGWDLGVDGMKVGERRKLFIPSQLAYGPRGSPPDIPGNAALVFDLELLKV